MSKLLLQIAHNFLQVFVLLYDLILPRLCVICGQSLLKQERCLCATCLVEMPRTRNHLQVDNRTSQIFWGRVPFVKATSLYYYQKESPFRASIYQLKYNNRPDVGEYLGEILANELLDCNFLDDIDVLIPLPLHPKRYRQRGYNQSLAICNGIASLSGLPIAPQAVRRLRYTETQTRRNREERHQNMQNAFTVSNLLFLKGKHVLLVDDVITTGASIEACSTALLAVSDIKISILSLAVTNDY